MKLILSGDLLRRAHRAVATEETRYYLTGAAVYPCKVGGALIVATNGHILLCMHDERAVIEDYPADEKKAPIVRLNSHCLAAIDGSKPSGDPWGDDREDVEYYAQTLVKVENNRAELYGCDAKTDNRAALCASGSLIGGTGPLIEGEFPNWRRVVPERCFPEVAAAPFNAHYLTAIGAALGSDGSTPIRILATKNNYAESSKDPHLVFTYATSNVKGFGVIMPMRDQSDWGDTLPPWATAA